MADQCHIPSRDSTGCFIRVHGDPPPAQQPSPIQLASNQLQPITTVVQEVANKSGIFTQRAAHHQANPQQVGEPVEDNLEESETEGLVGTPEIIGPSLKTFVQLPLPSAQPSIIPCLSPSQGQCHAPSQLNLEEPSHMCIHLTMDHDLTQLMHCHASAIQNILWQAISDIDGYLWAGRDGMLTACTPYSSIIHFDSCNQFHVHTYISCWGPGEQSPSLEIIFNS